MKTWFFFYNLCKHEQLGRLEQHPPQQKRLQRSSFFQQFWDEISSEFMICCWFWGAPQNWWQVAFSVNKCKRKILKQFASTRPTVSLSNQATPGEE